VCRPPSEYKSWPLIQPTTSRGGGHPAGGPEASSARRTGAGSSTTAGRRTPKPRAHAHGRARLGPPAPSTCCWATAARPIRARTSTRPRCRRNRDRPEGDRARHRGRRPEPTAGRVVGRAPRGVSSSRRDLRTSCAGHDKRLRDLLRGVGVTLQGRVSGHPGRAELIDDAHGQQPEGVQRDRLSLSMFQTPALIADLKCGAAAHPGRARGGIRRIRPSAPRAACG